MDYKKIVKFGAIWLFSLMALYTIAEAKEKVNVPVEAVVVARVPDYARDVESLPNKKIFK